MTNPEFAEWIDHHFSRFTGCTGWLSKFPTNSRHLGDPTQKSIIDGWREVLRPTALVHAKAASSRLASGEESFPDKGYDCHPSSVRRIALRLGGAEKNDQKRGFKFKVFDDEEVYDCKAGCKDTGFLTLWHPSALKFFKTHFVDAPPAHWPAWWRDPRAQQESRRGHLYEACVVLCTCELGMTKKSSAQRYDERRHIPYGNGDPRSAIEKFKLTPAGGSGLDDEF